MTPERAMQFHEALAALLEQYICEPENVEDRVVMDAMCMAVLMNCANSTTAAYAETAAQMGIKDIEKLVRQGQGLARLGELLWSVAEGFHV